MKHFLLIGILCLAAGQLPAQKTEQSEITDTSYFSLGEKQVEIIERNDSTFVKVWEEPDDRVSEDSDNDNSFDLNFSNGDKSRFRGHWAGFEFGMNNYVDQDFSINRTPENEFMDISTNRSWNFNLNFAQFSIPFASNYTGFVTGLGLEWSNYHFSNTSTIRKNTTTREIEPVDLNRDLYLNRLQTTYLTIPMIFELQFFGAQRKDRMYIAGGIIGGIKLGAHTKFKYSDDGNKKSNKLRDDYYLRPFRYGFTVRVGYKLLKVYMNYYPVSLFLEDRGPELYPVAMGFCITF